MKIIRYIFITALVVLLSMAIYGFISPKISLESSNASELNHSNIDPALHESIMTSYRLAATPWIALTSLILCGWIFLRHRKLVYSVAICSITVLAYIIYTSISRLGYTTGQSISAFLQGHGNSLTGWWWFYLASLVVLVAATWRNAEADAVNRHSAGS